MSRVAKSVAGSLVAMSGSRVAMSVAGINKSVVALFVRDQCSILLVSTLMLLYDERMQWSLSHTATMSFCFTGCTMFRH